MKNLFKSVYSKFLTCYLILAGSMLYCLATPIVSCNQLAGVKNVATAESNLKYAKAKQNCILYKTNGVSDNLQQQYFNVPESYFVIILDSLSTDIVKVAYKDFVGYCKTQDLSAVSFSPTTPYLNSITFDISQDAGTQVWSAPSDQAGTKLTTVPADSRALEYIASISGEVPIGGSSNIWYYARYTPASSSTKVYEGYIYSEAAINLTHIPTNLEQENEDIILPSSSGNINLNSTLKIILISLICLPFLVLFVITLIKGNRKLASKKLKNTQIEQTQTSAPAITKPNITRQPQRRTDINSLAKKQFTKKYTPNNNYQEEPAIEVVFPDYTFVDDDDLL